MCCPSGRCVLWKREHRSQLKRLLLGKKSPRPADELLPTAIYLCLTTGDWERQSEKKQHVFLHFSMLFRPLHFIFAQRAVSLAAAYLTLMWRVRFVMAACRPVMPVNILTLSILTVVGYNFSKVIMIIVRIALSLNWGSRICMKLYSAA